MTDMNEERFTREQRHKIYVKAKEVFLTGVTSCLCGAIAITVRIHELEYSYNQVPDDFPELLAKSPDVIDVDSHGFWWHIDDRVIREKVLDELIEETK
jgi:hypothetical protein